jgi:hypothetical protein
MADPQTDTGPVVLHESLGLRIHINKLNNFCVARLHYVADPAKRSPEWKAEAMAGMPLPKWEKEYEIEWNALSGAKVFPEIIVGRDKIIVEAPLPEISTGQTCWGGFDYGARNPSSFHVYTIIDGVTYSIWELFEPCRSIPDYVTKLKACPYWPQLRYIAADPSIFNQTQRNKYGQACSTADLFWEAGITKLIRGTHDEATWLAIMRAHWSNIDDPTFRIFSCCANQIREFENAKYVSMSDRMLLSQNYREAIADHDNHALDDCKYFMNSRPKIAKRGIKLPEMWRRLK